jgi:hypothetical protein
MVVMFVVCLCCVLQSLLVASLIVCKKVPEHTLKIRISPYYKVIRKYLVTHPRVHHTGKLISELREMGFEVDPYNPCVVNKIVKGEPNDNLVACG